MASVILFCIAQSCSRIVEKNHLFSMNMPKGTCMGGSLLHNKLSMCRPKKNRARFYCFQAPFHPEVPAASDYGVYLVQHQRAGVNCGVCSNVVDHWYQFFFNLPYAMLPMFRYRGVHCC
jgi:hypothetical protein